MDFEKRKAATMAAISSAQTDKSPKGSIDTPIIPLLTTLNTHPSFFTTSSCSGRISIFSHLPNKPKGGTWFFISHELVNSNSLLTLLFPPPESNSTLPELPESTHELVFRFEPLIIAVECKDLGSAQLLVSLAISSGFRESGITSVSSKRVIVAVRCSIRMEVPLGCRREIMISKEYVRYLVEIANEKMGANWKRTQGFMEMLKKNGFVGSAEVEIELMKLSGGGVDENENENESENGVNCEEDECRVVNPEMASLGNDSGPLESTGSSLAIVPITVVGEPLERFFIWGHSSCSISYAGQKEILIYGGFGGIGRHARRSDCILFDPLSGRIATLNVNGSPSPRLGHTASVIGDLMFVIGGRGDPANIMDDLWIFNITKTEWKLIRSTGNIFAPRHRHAAAVLGSNIYVFGGLNNETLHSSLHVLNIDTLVWEEVHASGELPSARHSHSFASHGSKLYLFGGYNGEKALGDLYSFDVQECRWSKLQTAGKTPYARFSHSMFVFDDYLGIIGGCPLRQHCQILSLLDLRNLMWKHMILDSVGKDLFVRSSANIVDNDLIMTGGGAAIYAFGTKFSEPAKINLLPLLMQGDASISSVIDKKQTIPQYEDISHKRNVDGVVVSSELDQDLNLDGRTISEINGHAEKAKYWVLKIQRKYGKLVKDVLKKFGWLDLGRKAYSHEDGSHLFFPVTEKFYGLLYCEQSQKRGAFEGLSELNFSKVSIDSDSMALNLLVTCGGTMHADELVALKKVSVSPLEAMRTNVASLLKHKGLSEELLEQLPTRWERLGDIFVLSITSFNDPAWYTIGGELWSAVAKSLGARRLARQGRVASNGTRDSRLEILIGENGWVEHCENGIVYCFDATKCMFSWGNLSEKVRMARLDCRGEVVVDLFAGIGYFTLPFLVRAQAKYVYSCEWNPYAVEALQHNLQANSVSERCIVLEGDNRLTAPKEVADRVCLGLLPSSEGSWVTAVQALRYEGGVLHIHGNVKDSEETQWTQHVVKSISEIAKSEGRCWEVSMLHVERVKWYAPHVRHLVADVRCEQVQR